MGGNASSIGSTEEGAGGVGQSRPIEETASEVCCSGEGDGERKEEQAEARTARGRFTWTTADKKGHSPRQNEGPRPTMTPISSK